MPSDVTTNSRDWVDVLATIPLFAGLSRRHLGKIAATATVRTIAGGSAIIRAGEPGDAFYVLLDGRVSVRRRGLPAISLGVNSFFGELALLDSGPRTATVVADGPVVCLMIPQSRFLRLLRSEPAIALAILREVAGRLRLAQATA
jgi:CRP-like cAMP-binding protein